MNHQHAVLALHQLHKSYGGKAVLKGVSLNVSCGEVLAILGPNGAGKTTLISVVLGLASADSGDVSIFNQPQLGSARTAALRQRVAVMMQIGSASANLTVAEQCDLFASYYAGGKSVAELLDIAGLQAQANTRFGNLSGGQKQRLLFALALAGNPELLFLDEPTLGMDVQARHALWQQITALKAAGVSIVLTTHYLEEAEQLADKIAVLQRGTIVALGSPDQLKARLGGKQICCRTALSDAQLLALPGIVDLQRRHGLVQLHSTSAEQTVLALLQADRSVSALEVKAVALEQAFLQLTAEQEAA